MKIMRSDPILLHNTTTLQYHIVKSLLILLKLYIKKKNKQVLKQHKILYNTKSCLITTLLFLL